MKMLTLNGNSAMVSVLLQTAWERVREWTSQKEACLIIFLITSITIPKLFCTESVREYANRQRCIALLCSAWAEEKSALWCFLVLNFKRKVKNVSKNSLYNPRHEFCILQSIIEIWIADLSMERTSGDEYFNETIVSKRTSLWKWNATLQPKAVRADRQG